MTATTFVRTMCWPAAVALVSSPMTGPAAPRDRSAGTSAGPAPIQNDIDTLRSGDEPEQLAKYAALVDSQSAFLGDYFPDNGVVGIGTPVQWLYFHPVFTRGKFGLFYRFTSTITFFREQATH